MKHVLLTLAALSTLFSTTVFASCPDFLNHSMRKLASTEEVQFCEAYEGKAFDREHRQLLRLYLPV
ncbi:MAG: hypothetical protein CM15mP125_1560 [Gammaproteobacteria bacterium]|nr:MAG: hypothetical protein CM15mP125_1560 [Gammaproteobacteria bacterium]